MTMTAVVADAAAGLPTDDPVAISAAACLFRGFGDPARLTILRHLADSDDKVKDLTDRLGLAQSTVSGHLACLRDCGLVESRPEGRASAFRLAHHQAALDLLAAAERLLVLTGDAVVLCPTYGDSTSTGLA